MFEKIGRLFEEKMNKILNRMEDPRDQLEYAYQKQVQSLHDMEMQLTGVVAARRRLEIQKQHLDEQVLKLENQARAALQQNREDLAKLAIQRKATLKAQEDSLNAQIVHLNDEISKLESTHTEVKSKIDELASEKELLKAEYASSAAEVKIKESISGMSRGAANCGQLIDNARDKILGMQTKAEAMDELLATGGLTDLLEIHHKDAIEAELDKAQMGATVDDELSRLKSEIGK
jgi:phage shock protein A